MVGAAEPSPDDEHEVAELVTALSRVEAQDAALTQAEGNVRTFLASRVLLAKAAKPLQALIDRIKVTKRTLAAAAFEAHAARRGRDLAAASHATQPARDAADVAEKLCVEVRAFLDDSANVDAAAEAKERARVEVLAAQQRKKEDARLAAEAERDRQKEAERRRTEEAAAKAAAQKSAALAQQADAEAKRKSAAEEAEAKKKSAAEEAEAKKKAQLEEKERAKRDAELLAQQALAAKQAEVAKRAAAEESSLRSRVEQQSKETDERVRADLDQCSQSIATLTMLEMSSRGLAKVTEAKVSLQNHKDKLRGVLGKLTVAKGKVPLKVAADEVSQCNEESKALAKETARLVAAAKALKN